MLKLLELDTRGNPFSDTLVPIASVTLYFGLMAIPLAQIGHNFESLVSVTLAYEGVIASLYLMLDWLEQNMPQKTEWEYHYGFCPHGKKNSYFCSSCYAQQQSV